MKYAPVLAFVLLFSACENTNHNSLPSELSEIPDYSAEVTSPQGWYDGFIDLDFHRLPTPSIEPDACDTVDDVLFEEEFLYSFGASHYIVDELGQGGELRLVKLRERGICVDYIPHIGLDKLQACKAVVAAVNTIWRNEEGGMALSPKQLDIIMWPSVDASYFDSNVQKMITHHTTLPGEDYWCHLGED